MKCNRNAEENSSPARRSLIREPFCAFSHLFGAVLSLVGMIALIVVAAGRPWHIVGAVIYGVSLVFLYLSSGIYHTLPLDENGESRLARLDHAAIFCLIAGTYTPVCLVTLRGALGAGILTVEWAIALFGVYVHAFDKKMPDAVRVALYIVMGWVAVVALGPMRQVLPWNGIAWLVGGGIVYTVGAVVYATNRPHLWPGKFSAHDLWHIFVLAGSACHFLFIFRFVSSMHPWR